MIKSLSQVAHLLPMINQEGGAMPGEGLTALQTVTRFVLVSKPGEITDSTGHDRTSLAIFIGTDHAGALLEILTEFATRNVNLTFIQSRPTGKELGDYHFIVDAEGHINDANVSQAVARLREICEEIRFLGSYPREESK